MITSASLSKTEKCATSPFRAYTRHLRKLFVVILATVMISLPSLRSVNAAAGDRDPSFGIGGIVIDNDGFPNAMVIQPDGKIIVVGSSQAASQQGGFMLWRFQTDGSLDPTFGNGGRVIGDVTASVGEGARAVALQPDGKIVVAGTGIFGLGIFTREDFFVVRYNSDGSIDPAFGTNGRTFTDFFGFNDNANALAIQSDGKIVVAGSAAINNQSPNGTPPVTDFAVARYDSNGVLDPTFGTGGKAV